MSRDCCNYPAVYQEAITIFLPETRYLSLDAEQKRTGRSAQASAAPAARSTEPTEMSPRVFVILVAVACISQAYSRPVRKTLNFNMFVLRPRQDAPDRFLLSTDGVSRFGPILEYLVQRVQGLMSLRLHQDKPENQTDLPLDQAVDVPIADTAENEVDALPESRMPGVVVRPSRSKPGTYEVEINVLVDDGQPEEKKDK